MTDNAAADIADDTEVVIEAPCGDLLGRWGSGVARFAGIPFAAPPTGQRRFRPPEPAAKWDGVRNALHFAPICPQNPSMMDALFGGEAEQWDEDCLHLNVWSPKPEGDADLPVMVWIHGGGFEMGSGSSPLYHGESFARDGVVYVSINYRLGSLGFLELGHLDPELAGSGNVGLLDQVAALRWVRDNISSFGGDPGNVTIFGESAGAMSVSLLLAMPEAEGLFSKVISQSGALATAKAPAQAAADTEEFMAHAAVDSVDALRDLPIEQLLAAHAAMSAARMAEPEEVIRRFGSPLAFLAFRPVADGAAVPTDAIAKVAAGEVPRVPLLIGSNLEEWKLFAMMAPGSQSTDDLRERLKMLTPSPDEALAVYESEHPGASPADLESAALTDVVFRIPATQMADAHAAHSDVWQYRFDWRSPALGGLLGAAHAIEIPFVFDMVEDHRLHVLVGAEAPVALSRGVHAAWVAFARTGSPELDGVGWPSRSGGSRPVLVLDNEVTLVDDPQSATREFWAR